MQVVKNMKLPARQYNGGASKYPDLTVNDGFTSKCTSARKAKGQRDAAWQAYSKRGQKIATRIVDNTLYVKRIK